MKRWVFTILLFLLLGAIVNVAVAWCVAVAKDWPYLSSTPGIVVEQVPWPRRVPDHWPELTGGTEISSFGVDYGLYRAVAVEDGADDEPDAIDVFQLETCRFGWPIRALEYTSWSDRVRVTRARGPEYSRFDSQPEETYWTHGIPIDLSRLGFEQRLHNHLPAHPIWAGFVMNTLTFGIILWLLILGPFVLRRLIRRTRGRCPKCGYDLRGAEHHRCPECGTVVSRAWQARADTP